MAGADHYAQMRFASRNAITSVGGVCGKEHACDAARGMLQGGVDELIIMLGERAAYDEITKIADGLMRASAAADWKPKGE